jgi:hypothetical protein
MSSIYKYEMAAHVKTIESATCWHSFQWLEATSSYDARNDKENCVAHMLIYDCGSIYVVLIVY